MVCHASLQPVFAPVKHSVSLPRTFRQRKQTIAASVQHLVELAQAGSLTLDKGTLRKKSASPLQKTKAFIGWLDVCAAALLQPPSTAQTKL